MPDQVIQFEGAEHHFPEDFTDQDIAKALKLAHPAPTTNGISQFLDTLGSDALNLIPSLAQTAAHPIDTALAMSANQRAKAKESFAGGNYLDALTHGIGGIAPIPYLPPFLADTLTDIGSSSNLGRGAARLAEMGIGGAGPKVIRNMEVPPMGPVSRFVGEHLLGLPKGSLGAVGKLHDLLRGSPEPPPNSPAPAPFTGKPGFSEGWTTDPQFHGGLKPIAPVAPSPFSITRSTGGPAPAIDPLAGTNIVPHPSGDFVPGSSQIPPVIPIKEGSPVPANAPSFRHPADYTDLNRQYHATHPKGTSLKSDAKLVFGLDGKTMPTYEQALAIHEWRLRNPGKTPTPGLK
jgi:hypothetical protein